MNKSCLLEKVKIRIHFKLFFSNEDAHCAGDFAKLKVFILNIPVSDMDKCEIFCFEAT